MQIVTLNIQKTGVPIIQEVQASLGCSHEGCRSDYSTLIVEETLEGIKVHNYCQRHADEFKEGVNNKIREVIEKLQSLLGAGVPADLKNLFDKNKGDDLPSGRRK